MVSIWIQTLANSIEWAQASAFPALTMCPWMDSSNTHGVSGGEPGQESRTVRSAGYLEDGRQIRATAGNVQSGLVTWGAGSVSRAGTEAKQGPVRGAVLSATHVLQDL